MPNIEHGNLGADDKDRSSDIRFNDATVWDMTYSIHRALEVYHEDGQLTEMRQTIMSLDFSWETSAAQYINLYTSLK